MKHSTAETLPACESAPIGADDRRLSPWLRGLNGLAGIASVVMFLLAARLSPAAEGFGTHQQLGLPPCSTLALFGIRCPSCGMTTSWSLFVRGEWITSVQINAGGFLLATIALVYLPASCYLCISGRASRGGWLSLALAIALSVALVVAFVQWGWRLAT